MINTTKTTTKEQKIYNYELYFPEDKFKIREFVDKFMEKKKKLNNKITNVSWNVYIQIDYDIDNNNPKQEKLKLK